MNAIAIDIKDMLVADSSLGLILADNLFIAREPDQPDNCVTLYDIAGAQPDITLNNENYNRDAFQVRVRNNSYIAGMQQMYAIIDSLHGRINEEWNNTTYTFIRMYMPPFVLQWDENNRIVIVASLEAQRR